MEKKYRVIIGDPFGGYACIKANISAEEADEIVSNEDADYFTSVFKVENDDILYMDLVPMEQ
jgi:hypothetical protein